MQNKVDSHKVWLILSISLVVVLVLFLALYSPVKDAIFGKATSGITIGDISLKPVDSLSQINSNIQKIYQITCTGNPTKDTPNIQAALDKKPGYILLSNGVCVVDKTLYILQTRGLRFEGQGSHLEGTKLEWRGSPNTPMFSLQGSRSIVFKHLLIQTGSEYTLESAFDMYNDCFHSACIDYKVGSALSSHANQFEDIYIVGTKVGILKDGIRILLPPSFGTIDNPSCGKGADCANDGHRFYNVQVGGYRGTAFVIEGVNSKGNFFSGSMCNSYIPPGQAPQDLIKYSGKSCVSTAKLRKNGKAISGAFSWYGGWAIANADADFVLGSPNDVIIISGAYSEKSKMFLRTESGASFISFPVKIESVRFAEDYVHKWDSSSTMENKKGIIIDYGFNGPLTISGSKFGTLSGSTLTNIAICWRIPSNLKKEGGSFFFQGNSIITNRYTDFFTPETNCYPPTTQQSNMIKRQPVGSVTGWSFQRMPGVLGEISLDIDKDKNGCISSGEYNIFKAEYKKNIDNIQCVG